MTDADAVEPLPDARELFDQVELTAADMRSRMRYAPSEKITVTLPYNPQLAEVYAEVQCIAARQDPHLIVEVASPDGLHEMVQQRAAAVEKAAATIRAAIARRRQWALKDIEVRERATGKGQWRGQYGMEGSGSSQLFADGQPVAAFTATGHQHDMFLVQRLVGEAAERAVGAIKECEAWEDLLGLLPALNLNEAQQLMVGAWLINYAVDYREDGSHAWP